eukprot:3556578-Pleurochrysis_carterae.AAC.5
MAERGQPLCTQNWTLACVPFFSLSWPPLSPMGSNRRACVGIDNSRFVCRTRCTCLGAGRELNFADQLLSAERIVLFSRKIDVRASS